MKSVILCTYSGDQVVVQDVTARVRTLQQRSVARSRDLLVAVHAHIVT